MDKESQQASPHNISSIDAVVWIIIGILTAIIWFLAGPAVALIGSIIYVTAALITGIYSYLYEFSDFDREAFKKEGFWWELYLIVTYWWALWIFKVSKN